MGYRIGIITNNNPLFSNGLSQNAYFLYEVFTNAGHTCTMLCYDHSYLRVEGTDVPVKPISTKGFNFKSYDFIITVAQGISKEMYESKGKTVVIGFVCGNIFANNLVDFISDDEGSGSKVIRKTQPLNKLWIIGGYDFMNRYLELMRGAPAISVPHLWSPRLLEQQAIKKFNYDVKELHYTPELHTNGKITIIILEPNVAFTKTSLLPLMACEAFHLANPAIIDTVFLFNIPKGGAAAAIIDNLTIASKVRRFVGLHIAEILCYANKQASMPIVLSHQILNPWNYLYYEMMYYGVPLVHNSFKMKGFGYYYSEQDIDGAVKSIMQAQEYHNKIGVVQKKKNYEFLRSIDPGQEGTIKTWNELLCSALKPS
jgi:hypothetical protein